MTAVAILGMLFCAMALIGLVRLVHDLLVEHAFEAPTVTCETPAAQPERRQESLQQTLTSNR